MYAHEGRRRVERAITCWHMLEHQPDFLFRRDLGVTSYDPCRFNVTSAAGKARADPCMFDSEFWVDKTLRGKLDKH